MTLEIICGIAAGYQLFAIVASFAFKAHRPAARQQPGAVSILNPVHGVDPAMREAIASHAALEGDYEFLCGVRDGDPALELIREFPKAHIVPTSTQTPNLKVGVLIDLGQAARNPLLFWQLLSALLGLIVRALR